MKKMILKLLLSALFAAALMLLLNGCSENPLSQEEEIRPVVLAPKTYRDLNRYFSEVDYRWNGLEQGIPPIIVKTLPEDLHRIPRISIRKKIFFMSLLPMVLLENEEIRKKRERLQDILDRSESWDSMEASEQLFLEILGEEYHLEPDRQDMLRSLEELLRRVDILPPSLVLAQAANESGYGTSRFARLGNNLFGEWTHIQGTGIVPLNRPAGTSHEVRRFESVHGSLISYMKNLNTHGAYRSLRDIRYQLRRKGKYPNGMDLAHGLVLYSSRRGEYVREIRFMIRANNLSRLADASLRFPPSVLLKDRFRNSGGGLLSSRGPAARRTI